MKTACYCPSLNQSFPLCTKMELKITNTTASFRVERVNFEEIKSKCEWTNGQINLNNFSVRRFQAMKRKIDIGNQNVTALIYQSGGIVLIGAKSKEQVEEASMVLASDLKLVVLKEPTISNVAGSCTFKAPLKLWNFLQFLKRNTIQCSEWCDLNEEFFPALRVRMKKKEKPVYLIFPSGKVIITGCIDITTLIKHHALLIKLYTKFTE